MTKRLTEEERKEHNRQYQVEWKKRNKKKLAGYRKKALEKNRDEINKKKRQKYNDNPEPQRQRSKKWRDENPDKRKQQFANYYQKNRTVLIKKNTEYAKEVFVDKRDNINARRRKTYKHDPLIRLKKDADWRAQNPDKCKQYIRRSKDKKKNTEAFFNTLAMSNVIINSQGKIK